MYLSKPLFALLTVTLALTLFSFLQIPTIQMVDESDLLAARHQAMNSDNSAINTIVWRRNPYQWKQDTSLMTSPILKTVIVPVINPPTLSVATDSVSTTMIDRSLVINTPTPRFHYFGQLQRDKKIWAFIKQNDDISAVPVGQVIDDEWRIDAVNGDQLILTYLPSKVVKTLKLLDE